MHASSMFMEDDEGTMKTTCLSEDIQLSDVIMQSQYLAYK